MKFHEKPEWMQDKVWAVRKLILDSGDAAHWTELLHIHIEDDNLEDHWFDDESVRSGDSYKNAEQWERDIFDALGTLNEDQRYQAVSGYPCPASCSYGEGCIYTDAVQCGKWKGFL